MKFIDKKTVFVQGNIYTNMLMDPRLLENEGITIYVKGDVFFGMMNKPNKLRTNDFYLDYEEFIKNHGPIYDIIASYNEV